MVRVHPGFPRPSLRPGSDPVPEPAMAPRKVSLPPLRPMKADELFLRWLSHPGTQRALRAGLRRIQGPTMTPDPAAEVLATTPNIALVGHYCGRRHF